MHAEQTMATAEHPLNAFMKSIFHTYLVGVKALIILIANCKWTNILLTFSQHIYFFQPNSSIKHYHGIWIHSFLPV